MWIGIKRRRNVYDSGERKESAAKCDRRLREMGSAETNNANVIIPQRSQLETVS